MATNKTQTVETLTKDIQSASGVYLADFTGITVQTVTGLRRDLRKKGIKMRVAKNTLIRRALNNNGISGLDAYLAGPSALIIADAEDPIAPAKLLVDFQKANEGLLPLKAINIDGQVSKGDQLVAISKTPGKRELQAQVVSLAMGPGSNLLALVKGPGSKVASQIAALVEKLEKGEAVQAA
jgi:large subunit ribosomal protein L10